MSHPPAGPPQGTGGNRLTGRVLVAADRADHRKALRDILEAQGHEIIQAADGVSALEHANDSAPDVVLLDVRMPGMDGLEVCRRLKADPQTTAIPVLLVTPLGDREERLLGIGAGANDYIAEPIDEDDLNLRVRNAIRTRRLYSEIAAQHERLVNLELLRDSQLRLVVHDLRSPLAGIRANLELLKMDGAGKLDAEMTESIEEARRVAVEMTDMVSDLLDVSRLEEGKRPLELATVDVGAVAAAVAAVSVGPHSRVSVNVEAPSTPARARADGAIIGRVLANLVRSAVRVAPAASEVSVTVNGDGREVRVSVSDMGPIIPREYQEKIFEKYGQVETVRSGAHRSSGLSLTFCKVAVEAHGGRIGLHSAAGVGNTFWFALPAGGPPATIPAP